MNCGIITIGFTIPMKTIEGFHVPNIRIDFTKDDLSAPGKILRPKTLLFVVLDQTSTIKFTKCTATKQIWDTVVSDHEKNSQVSKFRVAMYSLNMKHSK